MNRTRCEKTEIAESYIPAVCVTVLLWTHWQPSNCRATVPAGFIALHHILLISQVNSCPILMFEYSFRSLGSPLQEFEVILSLGGL